MPAPIHPNQRTATQQRVLDHASRIDAGGFFNLLTGPPLLDRVAALVPEHRERAFPPTEMLALFMAQALSADGSCRQVLDDHAVKRAIAGLPRASVPARARSARPAPDCRCRWSRP